MIKTVKGTKDILPKDISQWIHVENRARTIFSVYGFEEIRTPLFESTSLFTRTLGQDTDVVSKEMYTFLDRKNRSISLRPEGTASVVRAFLEHGLKQTVGPQKLFYIGPMFRYERPQAGRMRQFHQIGAECLGASSALTDVDMVLMLIHFLEDLGIQDVSLQVNFLGGEADRVAYKKVLHVALKDHLIELCQDCLIRYEKNILRILDCKKKTCQSIIKTLPPLSDFISENSLEHFALIRSYLDRLDIQYDHNPLLVRGLDYYTGFVFEAVSSSLGAHNVLAAGGRYDNLVSVLGGENTPAIGFAIGLERLCLCLSSVMLKEDSQRQGICWIALDDQAMDKSLTLVKSLRKEQVRVEMAYDSKTKSLKSQMRFADKKNFRWGFILGSNELKDNVVRVKDFLNGEEKNLKFNHILDWVKQEKK